MDFQGIYDRLVALRAPGLLRADEPRPPDPKDKKDKGRAGDPYVLVDREKLPQFLELCRDDDRLHFEQLIDITATDPSKDSTDLWVNVMLLSLKLRHRLSIKCLVPKSDPKLPTTVPIYRASQWNERECAEMFGLTFVGHPDPRHILLPDDWVGFPLRKDYEFPKEYHGISCE
jgi:NADH-quinone oxidoreductase subunit C